MSLLIRSLLPSEGTLEANEINRRCLMLPDTAKQGAVRLRVAEVLLRVLVETVDAVIDCRYGAFDPLVKNFGCQINAREISSICKRSTRESLVVEALRIKKCIQSMDAIIMPELDGETSFADYLISKAKIGLQIAPEIARLVRMRLLCIVNSNIVKQSPDGPVEVPITQVSLLASYAVSDKTATKPIIELIVNGLQAEEAQCAATYIRRCALTIPQPRGAYIERALVEARLSKVKEDGQKRVIQTAIVSLPLMHNTEAVFRSYQGIVCVKNKLRLLDQPIPDALPKMLFLQMPGATPVDPRSLSSEEPVIVIKGFIDNNTKLKEAICEEGGDNMEEGLINILNANCARYWQFASGASADPLCDKEAQNEVVRFKSVDFERAYRCVRIDHIYCLSLGEALDEEAT